jgi:hypothetical protein
VPRMTAAFIGAIGLGLTACNASDPAELKSFNLCQSATARAYPDSSRPGELVVDAKHIEDVGNGMEGCMYGYGYNYDESKPGCKLPPSYDANFYFLKSNSSCYSAINTK